MYLPRSSRWSMNRRRKRPNLFGWTVFGLVLLFGYYFDQVYLPTQPNPFEATPTATRSAESFTTEAEQLFNDGKLLQSIEAYKSAIKSSTQDPTLYIALARVQVFAGFPKDAQANAENAILLSAGNSMAHAVLAWALDFQGGSQNNARALDEIQTAIKYDDHNAIAHAYYVEILVDSGQFENYAKAVEESRVAAALAPDLVETHRARAYILSATGSEGNNYELAVQELREAIKINKNISLLHMELGKNLRTLQVYDDAINEFTIANTLNPSDAEPDYLISRTYATEGEYEKALQYAETAVKDAPTNAMYRGNYGLMFYKNFLYPKAVQQLKLAVNGGKTDDGLDIQGIALTNDIHVTEIYYTYGYALARVNQCGDALRVVQQLQTELPSDDNVTEAATGITNICQENLDNPAVDTPTATIEATSTPEGTDTPEPTVTSEATSAP
jgi:tetratricopeptide (TPR) repeat protein